MITIFTTPKDFEGHFDIIQTNAINSWRALSNEIEIIIFGKSKGVKEISKSISAIHIQDNKTNKYDTPFLNDMFNIAQKESKFDILCYINSDIILPINFLDEVKICVNRFSKFLMVGHRWDLNYTKKIDYNNAKKITEFWNFAREKSKKHPPSGIDYHIFTKHLWGDIPPFLIGWKYGAGYDNWLIWKARRKLIPVIDATEKVFIIHQNHDYSSMNTTKNKVNEIGSVYRGPEAEHNIQYLGNNNSMAMNLLDCTHKIYNQTIEKKSAKDEKIRRLFKLPKVFPELTIPIKLYRMLYLKYYC